MIPSLRPPRLLAKTALLQRGGKPVEAAAAAAEAETRPQSKPETKRVWWLRGITLLAVSCLVASQALIDVAGWSYTAFGFGVMLAGLLLLGSLRGFCRLKLRRWVWVPIAFLSFCFLRSFSETKDTHPFDVLMSLTSAFLCGSAVAAALPAGMHFKALAYAQVASNLLQMLIVLFGLGPEPPPGTEAFRYAGITGNPNELALQLTLGACLIWLQPRKAGLLPCLFTFGAVGFALVTTGSRKAVLVALFFLVLVLIQAVEMVPKKRRRLFATAAIAVPCLLGIFLAPLIIGQVQEILAVRRVLEYEDSSYQTRANMIEEGVQLWRQEPLFGNGLDAFRGLSGEGTYAHSNYAELLCDIGILGTLLFYAIHAHVVIRANRLPAFLKFYCWVFILLMMVADTACVSYNRKQSVLILMVLMAVTTSSRYAVHEKHSSAASAPVLLKRLKPRPRRFVLTD